MEVARIINPPDALLFPARNDDTPGQRERKASAAAERSAWRLTGSRAWRLSRRKLLHGKSVDRETAKL
jgi:hypothetical protein